MKSIILLIVSASLVGCSSTKPYSVRIESDPPGARVFLSLGATAKQAAKHREYLGQTPCTATVTGTRQGYFVIPKIAYASDYVSGSATFFAEPTGDGTNLFPQSVVYRGKSSYVQGDKIPQAVFFDLHKR